MRPFPISSEKLSKGLRLLMLPRAETETVTLLVLIGVGSRYETSKQWGLSHFLEHMFFKGTQRRPSTKEIAEAIDDVGGEFNAFTGEEYTGYYVKLAASQFDTGADVVSDILLRSLFPEEEIERERGVITEEINMYSEAPMHHVKHLWQEGLFGSHPLGRRIDGSVDTVSKMKRQDFVEYTGKHYHSGNTVVTVAGRFEQKKVRKSLQSLFKPISDGRETKPKPAPKILPAREVVFESRPALDQTHLVVGVPGVGLHDERRWAVQLLAAILGGSMSSRLFLSVRERNGLAYAIRTSSDNYTDAGSLATQVGARTDKAEKALALILEEYDRVQEELVSDKELARVKEIAGGHMMIELEETNALAVFAGGQELLDEKVLTPAMIWKRISAVTRNEVREAARDLLGKEKRALALLGPQKSAASFGMLLKK